MDANSSSALSNIGDDSNTKASDYGLNYGNPGGWSFSGSIPRPSLGLGPKTFPLLKLPPELRLWIYEPLIAVGDVNILRTNKLVNQEAGRMMRNNAVLRMSFGYPDRTSFASFPLAGSINLARNLTIHATSFIQHVEFRFNMTAGGERSNFFDTYTNLIKSFGGRDISRQSCTIILDLGLDYCVPDEEWFEEETAWQAVADLTGFKVLVLKLSRERDHVFERHFARVLGTLYGYTEDSLPHKWLLNEYKDIRETLEITLGPAFLNKSVEHHCLEFYPRDFKPEEVPEEDVETDGDM